MFKSCFYRNTLWRESSVLQPPTLLTFFIIRFNVAITRAKALMVIIGNPHILGQVQCSAVHYTTLQYSSPQYSTVQYSTVQHSTVQHSTVQYSTVWLDRYSTVHSGLYSTVHPESYNTLHPWTRTVKYSRVRYILEQYILGQ